MSDLKFDFTNKTALFILSNSAGRREAALEPDRLHQNRLYVRARVEREAQEKEGKVDGQTAEEDRLVKNSIA